MNTIALNFSLLLLSGTLISAVAEELPDPTLPPIGIGAVTGHGGRGEAEAGAEAGGRSRDEVAQKGLQSVIIAPDYRAAIINGQTVELGAKYGDAQLTEVNESGVVLSGARGKQKLMLMFPAVEIMKKNSSPVSQQDDAKTKVNEKRAVGKAASNAAGQEE
jgi:hypothetical protein